jgi:hypothetical protein
MVKSSRMVALLGVALASSASLAGAQEMTGFPAVDSAAVARAAWGRAAKALTAHDVAVARHEVTRAAESWPIQPSYLWAEAVLAAQAGDTAATLRALQAYAGLGLGRNLRAEVAFSPFITLPAFAATMAAHDAHRAPVARSREVARLADSTFWPEGIDYDARTRRYYVASVRHRTIAEISPDGSTRELWPRDGAVVGAMFGGRVDASHGTLWATTSAVPQMANYGPADSTIAALLRIRIGDGTIERRWNIPPAPEGHTLGDLAIGPNGDVFVTDSNEPVLYWLRSGADTLGRSESALSLAAGHCAVSGRTCSLRRRLLAWDSARRPDDEIGDTRCRRARIDVARMRRARLGSRSNRRCTEWSRAGPDRSVRAERVGRSIHRGESSRSELGDRR